MAKLLPTVTAFGCLAVAAIPLAGCQTVFDLVGVAQPLPASVSHQYDGSYQGKIRLVSGAPGQCPPGEGERVVMIGDGVLWYAYSPDIFVTLPVNYDGTISGKADNTEMVGRIDGNHLLLTLKSPRCLTQMSMYYIYNHS